MSQKIFIKTAIEQEIFNELKEYSKSKGQGISKTISDMLKKTKEQNQEKEKS